MITLEAMRKFFGWRLVINFGLMIISGIAMIALNFMPYSALVIMTK